MMVHTTNLSSSYLSNLDSNFVGLGLGGRGGVWYRHSINFQFYKKNLICENSSCSWRFQRCRSCNYRMSRDRAIRCDADGSRREGIFIGLGGHWCLIPRHSINFQFYKTNLICENISCSWRFWRCRLCNYPISRGGAIRCDTDGSRREEGIYLLGLAATGVWYPAIQSIFRFIRQTWYEGIAPARGASGGVGFVIIVWSGAEISMVIWLTTWYS